jgi:hypothetical protein
MLSVIMLSFVMLNVVILFVVKLSVVAPTFVCQHLTRVEAPDMTNTLAYSNTKLIIAVKSFRVEAPRFLNLRHFKASIKPLETNPTKYFGS